MVDQAVALSTLEQLMCEFFAPYTSNERKREIESMLEEFSKRRDAWRHCLYFMRHSQNEYVLMFTLNTFENIINRQWASLRIEERSEIRIMIWQHLLREHKQMQYFIRNKTAMLIVSIAMYDWPHDYPDFMDNIVELINEGGSNTYLGLVLAHSASEELGTIRESAILASARRKDIHSYMLRATPHLLQALGGILERYANKDPTANLMTPSALPDILTSTQQLNVTDRSIVTETIVKCLNTLQHLFSWLPLSSHVPPSLVTTVFYWGSWAVMQQPQWESVWCSGVSAASELLYRRYAPPAAAAAALRLQHAALAALSHLTKHTLVRKLPHDYLTKLAEFLRLFISLHFKRLEAEQEFDSIQFLSYIFQFTFQVPTCDIFVNCLDIWIQFMEALKPEDVEKYIEALMALVNGILNKIQYQHNKHQLQTLDDQTADDDGVTEWETFLKNCIDCVSHVAELAPMQVFNQVCERWECVRDALWRCAGGGGVSMGGERAVLLARDLDALTRLLGTLAPHVLSEDVSPRREPAYTSVMDKVCSVIQASPHKHHTSQPKLFTALTELVRSMIWCSRGWWMSWCAGGGTCSNVPSVLQYVQHMLMPQSQEPAKITKASAELILSIAKSLKTDDNPINVFDKLFAQSQRSLDHLDNYSAETARSALLCAWVRGNNTGPAPFNTNSGPSMLTLRLSMCADLDTKAKRALPVALQEPIQAALVSLRSGDINEELMELFVTLFTHLLPQLGDQFGTNVIDVLLHHTVNCRDESTLERVVCCVRLAVEGGSVKGTHYTSVLTLVDHILTRATDHDLLTELYLLIASILSQRWRHYFLTNGGSPDEQRKSELRALLSALGRSLTLQDVEIYRLNLTTLESLNTKWRLYHKEIFRYEFLNSFIHVILSSVVERRPLRDESLQTLHSLASVDFVTFRETFLPSYLSAIPGLSDQQKHTLLHFTIETDLPTFTQCIQSFANDLYCYQMCNMYLNAPINTQLFVR